MSSFQACKAALDMALRHHGPGADFDTLFNTADRFVEYLDRGHAKPQPPGARWTESMRAEFAECATDPIAFLKHVKIQHVMKGSIPFQPYAFQEDFVRLIHQERFSHVTHARQMGITTCLAAFALWSAMFEESDAPTVIVSRSMYGSMEILYRIRQMYETLPEHLRIKVKTYNKTQIEFENGSRIQAIAASSGTLKGRSVKNLFVDQMAWISHGLGREFWQANYPVVASGTKTRVVLTSSGGDTDGIFYDIKRTIPDNGFAGMTIPWQVHPERDEQWAKPFRDHLGEARFRQEFECEFVAQPRIQRQDKPAP